MATRTTHRHRSVRTSEDRCFCHCVGGDDCNPAAHGGIAYTQYCHCGASREVASNGAHIEYSEWSE